MNLTLREALESSEYENIKTRFLMDAAVFGLHPLKGGISDGKAVLDWVEREFSCDIEDISVNEMVIQLGLNLFRLVKYPDAAFCTRGAVIRAMKERGSRNVLFDFSTLVFGQKQ